MCCLFDRLMLRRSSSSGVDAVADEAAVTRDRRRLFDERAVQLVAQVGEIVELGDEAPDERRVQLGQQHAHARHGRDGLPQRDEVARPRDAERRAGHEALDVVNRLERLAQLGAFGRSECQLLDGVEPILNPLERDERPEQPRAQEPAAHRRHRAVDLVQQRSGAAAVGGVDHLEVAERGRIDEEAVGAGAKRNLTDVRKIGLLRVAQVVDERAGRANGGGPILETKPEEALRPQLIEQRSTRRLLIEGPSGGVGHSRSDSDLGHERRRVVEALGRDDLAGLEDRELVGQRLSSIGAVVLRRRELAGREIEQGHAESWRRQGRRDGHQERGLARLEIPGVGQRSGRHDAHDFAAHEALGLPGILDLFADGDAESLPDEPGDVAVGGVERHAAHRNRAAAGILRTRGERELERAGGGERVLVEHLVEVAHPEKHDGVAVLTLRVEVLPHGRGRPGRFGEDRGGHLSCAGRFGSGEPVGPSITLSRHVLVLALDTTSRSGSAAVVRTASSSAKSSATGRERTASGCRAT